MEAQAMWVATEGTGPVLLGDEAVRLGNIRLDPASDSAYLLQSNPLELKTPLEGTGGSQYREVEAASEIWNGLHGYAVKAILLAGNAGIIQGHQKGSPGKNVINAPPIHRESTRLPIRFSHQRGSGHARGLDPLISSLLPKL